MNDIGDSGLGARRRIVTRGVTFEPHGDGVRPIAVCPRRLTLLPVAQCAPCPDFVQLCVNPASGPPFICCSFDEAPFVHASEVSTEPATDLHSLQGQCIADVMTALTPEAAANAHELMLSTRLVVASDASIGQVAAMMAFERVQVVLVVDEAHSCVGTVSALDLVRWLACRLGYVVPG